MSQSIRKSVMQASKQWIANFNEGNVQACIKRYMANASMSVTPFGKFDGINAIGEFWQQFATKKPTNLVYRNVQIKVLNERQAVLSANWTMNIASGFISKELWTLAGDGKWYLQEDDFSVLSQHDSPIPHSKRTALVLVDLQNDYFENGRFELENTYAVSVQAKQLLTTFRQHEMPVIHIQHIFESEEAPFFAPNTSGADIAKHLAPLANEPVIVKHEIDSFSNTSLEQTLVELGVEKLVVVGAMAQACVQTICRSATLKGFQCDVVSDAIAAPSLTFQDESFTGRQLVAANLLSLSFGGAEITSTQECISRISS